MPPKKKRKVDLPDKPGIAREYLTTSFGCLPDVENLKNGHVLCQFILHNRVPCDTLLALCKYPVAKDQLQCIVKRTLLKFRNLNRAADFASFKLICEENFRLRAEKVTDRDAPALDNSASTPKPVASCSTPKPAASCSTPKPAASCSTPRHVETPVTPCLKSSLRKKDVTPREEKLVKRLDFVTRSKVEQKRSYMKNIQNLKEKLKKTSKVKHLNQANKRYKSTINRLRADLKNTSASKELALVKMELFRVKRNHRRLKEKKKVTECSNCEEMNEKIVSMTHERADDKDMIQCLQNKNLMLEEAVEDSEANSRLQKDGKLFPDEIRLLVYDSLINNVPTKSIPALIEKFTKRLGIPLSTIPHRSTVEMMERELGVLSDMVVGEMMMTQPNLTLCFDATTQDGIHVNEIHVTGKTSSRIIALDRLAGGTAEDYANHVLDAIKRVAEVYAECHSVGFEQTRSTIVGNISNTLTDRASVNHATISRLEQTWGKTLNELNCHLHPLDTIASSTRSILKSLQPSDMKGKVFGSDCMAANIVLGLNKLRYKDGKGDPKGFISFLDEVGLPRGILPRYRGNRLHIIFHICGKLHRHYITFVRFLSSRAAACGGLSASLLADLENPVAKTQIQVLGLMGKLLTGPWMTRFYQPAEQDKTSHMEGVEVLSKVVEKMTASLDTPLDVLSTKTDFFGQQLDVQDEIVTSLQEPPTSEDHDVFTSMMKRSIEAAVCVVDRQYSRYFNMEITDQLRQETETARLHNIDAEAVMGMFSAAKEHAPNATICYLSSKIRGQKNRVVDYIDNLDEVTRKTKIKLAVNLSRKQRTASRRKNKEIVAEIQSRIALKQEKREATDRRRIERVLKKKDFDPSVDFPELDEETRWQLVDILAGKVVGRNICHAWYDRQTRGTSMFHGKIEKLKRKAGGTYTVGYWGADESYNDAVDYDIPKSELATDFLCGDLTL